MSAGRAPGVAVRPAAAADAERLADLSGQLGYPTTPGDVARRLARLQEAGGHDVAVAVLDDGTLAGWIHLYLHEGLLDERLAEVGGLVVDAACRNRRIGQRLMEHAEEWARARGCRGLSVHSNVIRHDAHRFYERLGFTAVKSQLALVKRF
jgi:GNAT superfamily N-acetyltransferase